MTQQINEINDYTTNFLADLKITLNTYGWDIIASVNHNNLNCSCSYIVTFVELATQKTIGPYTIITYSHNSGYLNRPFYVALVTRYVKGKGISKYDDDMVVFRELDSKMARETIITWLSAGAPSPVLSMYTYINVSTSTECHCCAECNCTCCHSKGE